MCARVGVFASECEQEREERKKEKEEQLRLRGITPEKMHLTQTALQIEEQRQKTKRKDRNQVSGWDSECLHVDGASRH